jgi:hypothetical protein
MIPAVSATSAAGAGGLSYQWVAVGDSGNLYTSTSTTLATGSWTSRTSSFGTTQIRAVASNALTLYVAVGNSGKLASSPDGITWTQRTSQFSTDDIYDIAYGNGVWVAVGSAGKISTSTDGEIWTARTSGTATRLVSIAYGNGVWVAGGESGVLRTATDPTSTWTSRTSTITNSVFTYYAPSQAIWLAGSDVGTTGALASSTDAVTWTARTAPFTMAGATPLNSPGFASTNSIIVLTQTTNYLTPSCDVGSSTNGTTWTDRAPATTAEQMLGCCVDDTGTFAVTGLNNFQYSTNGTTWTNGGTVPFSLLDMCHSAGTPSIR